jgi:hypothetical protein
MPTCMITPAARRRLEMQGFVGYGDEELTAIGRGASLAPALTGLLAVAGAALGSPALVWAAALLALCCAAVGVHPADALYNRLVRPVSGGNPIPPSGRPRRFTCGLVTLWLGGAGLVLATGATALGGALAGLLALPALLAASTSFCFGAYLYKLLVRR